MKPRYSSGVKLLALALVLAAAAFTGAIRSAPAMAQVTTGSLQGVVFDQNKGVVANAPVKVTNAETGQERQAQTNAQGFYRVTNLIPGKSYKIEVKVTGFAPKIIENVEVLLGTAKAGEFEMVYSKTEHEYEPGTWRTVGSGSPTGSGVRSRPRTA